MPVKRQACLFNGIKPMVVLVDSKKERTRVLSGEPKDLEAVLFCGGCGREKKFVLGTGNFITWTDSAGADQFNLVDNFVPAQIGKKMCQENEHYYLFVTQLVFGVKMFAVYVCGRENCHHVLVQKTFEL